MSTRPLSTRGRRPEKDSASSDGTSGHDVKSGEFNARPRVPPTDKSPVAVPSRGGRWQTSDRSDSTGTRFSIGKPKDRDDPSFARRRSTDKIGGGFGGKGGRRVETSGHGGQRGNGQSNVAASSVTHGGGKLFISREFVTTGDMKSSSGGFIRTDTLIYSFTVFILLIPQCFRFSLVPLVLLLAPYYYFFAFSTI